MKLIINCVVGLFFFKLLACGGESSQSQVSPKYMLGADDESELFASQIVVDSNGNTYISGYTSSTIMGVENRGGVEPHFYISKYDLKGVLQWVIIDGADQGQTYIESLILTPEEDLLVVGTTTRSFDGSADSDPMSAPDFFVAKYNKDGNAILKKQHSTNHPVGALSVKLNNDNEIYLIFQLINNDFGLTRKGDRDIAIAKLNESFDIETISHYGEHMYSYSPYDVTFDSQNNIIVVGTYVMRSSQNKMSYIKKIDKDGNELWQHIEGVSTDKVQFSKVIVDANDNIYVSGDFTVLSDVDKVGLKDLIVKKFQTDGTENWSKTYGFENSDIVNNGIEIDSTGNIILVNTLKTKGISDQRGYILSLKPDSQLNWSREYINDGYQEYFYDSYIYNNKIFVSGGTTQKINDTEVNIHRAMIRVLDIPKK